MFETIKALLRENLECRFLAEDIASWEEVLGECVCAGLQYKPNFLSYQAAYFSDVYDAYEDVSVVLYRGGRAVGIWPLCVYEKDDQIHFGTAGTQVLPPLLPRLLKAEAQRAVFEKCLKTLFSVVPAEDSIVFSDTCMEGFSLWHRRLMECGGACTQVRHVLFTDLSLSQEDIQSRIRRTNKYSVAKGHEDYDVELYDASACDLAQIFSQFHALHVQVSGRETRSQLTWNIQQRGVAQGNTKTGDSFVVFIRDKVTEMLAGAALFDATPTCGLYCVAAYDRDRFSKPVGHIVQAVAMQRMRQDGVRWYEIGERPYEKDVGANSKTITIGYYKEGFATHVFPRIDIQLSKSSYLSHCSST